MCSIIACWLWPLIAGVLCGILGYLLGKSCGSKWKKKYEDLSSKHSSCDQEITDLKAKLDACESSKSSATATGISAFAAGAGAALIPFDADAAKAVFGKKIKQDDLKIVEGIGPKIEELFHNHGIKTWKALSEASVEKCQEVLNSGGDRFKMHVPRTWPKQAQLAYEGKWEELLKWQDELDGGK